MIDLLNTFVPHYNLRFYSPRRLSTKSDFIYVKVDEEDMTYKIGRASIEDY